MTREELKELKRILRKLQPRKRGYSLPSKKNYDRKRKRSDEDGL